MLSLREVQQRAYRAIVLEEDGVLAPRVREPRTAPARLDVYRNNARETFRKTLAVTYPVVQRLVGEPCFRGLAHAYSREFPSRSGDLGRYGAEFATLLEIYYRDTTFAYLADVARLEWACAEAATAADGVPVDLMRLAAVPADAYEELCFTLRAPVRLVSSRYPVLTIWAANQTDDAARVALDAGAEHVLVTRNGGGVQLYRLDAGTFAFARSLADGESLADACCAGETSAAAFDPRAALKTLAELELLAGFRLPADEVE